MDTTAISVSSLVVIIAVAKTISVAAPVVVFTITSFVTITWGGVGTKPVIV
jgi:hypothetical protein